MNLDSGPLQYVPIPDVDGTTYVNLTLEEYVPECIDDEPFLKALIGLGAEPVGPCHIPRIASITCRRLAGPWAADLWRIACLFMRTRVPVGRLSHVLLRLKTGLTRCYFGKHSARELLSGFSRVVGRDILARWQHHIVIETLAHGTTFDILPANSIAISSKVKLRLKCFVSTEAKETNDQEDYDHYSLGEFAEYLNSDLGMILGVTLFIPVTMDCECRHEELDLEEQHYGPNTTLFDFGVDYTFRWATRGTEMTVDITLGDILIYSLREPYYDPAGVVMPLSCYISRSLELARTVYPSISSMVMDDDLVNLEGLRLLSICRVKRAI